MSITLQAFSWHFPAFSNDCTQWVIRLQKEPGRWPGSHARTQGILDSAVCSEQPGVALVTQASQLEVSRATHTAQVGQIQSLLSTLSSLSCLHLITGARPWPAAGHTQKEGRTHSSTHCSPLGVLPLQTSKAIPLTTLGHTELLCSQVPLGQSPGILMFLVILGVESLYQCTYNRRAHIPGSGALCPATWHCCHQLPT